MADKILQTKIALLCKELSEWESEASYIPLKGEVCIATVPLNKGVIHNAPAVLLKVGDGVTTFSNLPWASALATDVYGWAKKSSLEFGDLSNDFIESLDERIVEKAGIDFRIIEVEDETHSWKLQKSISGGEWIDVSSFKVDPEVFATVEYVDEVKAELEEDINAKVDKEITGTNGKALIFNEADGGGAKFENNSGVESFVGVNDGSNGIAAQIYADKLINGKWQGAKLDVTNTGIYYTVGNESAAERDVEKNELATKGYIADEFDNLAEIARTGNVNDLVQTEGDILILNCNL